MKIVIRAGGVGARLWPMSRQHNPKQFHCFVGAESMLRDTFNRALIAVKDPANIFVSINITLLERLREELPELPEINIIKETDVRNTGPAMCLETSFLSKILSENEVIASVPSDDFISDARAFAELLKFSESFIKEKPDFILTPAVRPVYLDTGYSYMKAGELLKNGGDEAIFKVAKVVEKPEADYCKKLIDSGLYYCHTGMYIWRLGTIKNLFETLQPQMFKNCEQGIYADCEKMTIESAITDKAPKLAMSVSDKIGWSDLGKWHVIKRTLANNKENLIKGEVILNKADDNLVYNNNAKKIVVVNGVKGLVVVDTPDALFISSADDSAEVKACLDLIKEKGLEEYL